MMKNDEFDDFGDLKDASGLWTAIRFCLGWGAVVVAGCLLARTLWDWL